MIKVICINNIDKFGFTTSLTINKIYDAEIRYFKYPGKMKFYHIKNDSGLFSSYDKNCLMELREFNLKKLNI